MAAPSKLFSALPNRLQPAFGALPSLQRFSPSLKPRPSHTIALSLYDAVLSSMVRHMYHDLGICLYAGASLDKQRRIADLLAEIHADGHTSADLLFSRYAGEKSRSTVADSRSKYRLQTADHHIDPNLDPDQGVLSIGGVLELATQASLGWADEVKRVAKELFPNADPNVVVWAIDTLHRSRTGAGIMHTTTSGPRRLNVDVHVRASVKANGDGYRLDMFLYTVGTVQPVGNASLRVFLLDGKTTMTADQMVEVCEKLPTRRVPTKSNLKAIAKDIASLEYATWSKPPEKSESLEADEKSKSLEADEKSKSLEAGESSLQHEVSSPKKSKSLEADEKSKPVEAEETSVQPDGSSPTPDDAVGQRTQ